MLIPVEQLSNQKIYDVYRAAFMDPTIDEDGDVKVTIDGVRVFVRFDGDRRMLSMFAIFGLKPTATRHQALELANRFNDQLILVRCCVNTGSRGMYVYLDHWTPVYDGISPEALVTFIRRFKSVAADVGTQDQEDILS